jgi:hypothetical protein
MKNILIIYPHWPPSNLAGVHRARLIANFLPEFDWHPIILTVDPDYYEEKPDWDMLKTVNQEIEVIHVKAKKSKKTKNYWGYRIAIVLLFKKESTGNNPNKKD